MRSAHPTWAVFTPSRLVGRVLLNPAQVQPSITLAVDLRWQERVTIADGRLPAAWTGDENDDLHTDQRPPIEFVLPVESAALMELAIGDVVGWAPHRSSWSGPTSWTDPSDEYWLHAPALAVATETFTPSGHLATGAGFVDPATAVGMFPTFRDSTLRAWYPIDAAAMDFADADELIDQIASLEAIGDNLPTGETLTLRTGMEDTIEDVVGSVAAVAALLALAISGPLGVILAVYAIGVQAVIRRRSRTLALASARGASGLQLRGAMALEGIVLGVPAAAAGVILAGVLLPGPTGWAGSCFPIALALLPAVMFAVFASSQSIRAVRRDALRTGPRRWLRSRRSSAASPRSPSSSVPPRAGRVQCGRSASIRCFGCDPALLSLAVCLPSCSASCRSRCAGWGPGCAHDVARSACSAPPARCASPHSASRRHSALVVGIAVAVFSSVLATTGGDHSLETAAAEEVGADLQVVAPRLGESIVSEVGALEGVASIAPVQSGGRTQLVVARYSAEVLVIFTDTSELAQQRPPLPPGLDDADGPIPLLASADLRDRLRRRRGTLEGVPIRVAGIMPPGFLPATEGLWVLVDRGLRAGAGRDPARNPAHPHRCSARHRPACPRRGGERRRRGRPAEDEPMPTCR